MNNSVEKQLIKGIVLPNKPQLDPLAAYYLLLKYGHNKFENIDQAELMFWEKSETPDKQTLEQWRAGNIICIDVGEGRFDHHNKLNTTATSLVAEYLGIADNPELQTLLTYVEDDDFAGLHNRFGEMALLIKNMYLAEVEMDYVIHLALYIIDIFQAKERHWHIETRKEFEKKAKIFKVKKGKSKIKVGVIASDNHNIANYARQTQSLAAVIQQRSSGHVLITTNKIYRIDLRPVIGAIRLKESDMAGQTKPLTEKEAVKSGKHPQVSHWYYHDSLNAILNGSEAMAGTPATKLSLQQILDILIYGLTADVDKVCHDCPQGQHDNCIYQKIHPVLRKNHQQNQ